MQAITFAWTTSDGAPAGDVLGHLAAIPAKPANLPASEIHEELGTTVVVTVLVTVFFMLGAAYVVRRFSVPESSGPL